VPDFENLQFFIDVSGVYIVLLYPSVLIAHIVKLRPFPIGKNDYVQKQNFRNLLDATVHPNLK